MNYGLSTTAVAGNVADAEFGPPAKRGPTGGDPAEGELPKGEPLIASPAAVVLEALGIGTVGIPMVPTTPSEGGEAAAAGDDDVPSN